MFAQEFHLGTILSITHDYMLSPDRMQGIYDILNFMTNDDLYTHQLGRAVDECKPLLLEQLPFLDEITKRQIKTQIDSYPYNGDEDWVINLLEPLVAKYGAWHVVYRMGQEDHQVIDPIEEFIADYGNLEKTIFVIDLEDDIRDDYQGVYK